MKLNFILTALFIALSVAVNFAQQAAPENTFEVKGTVKDRANNILAGLHLNFKDANAKEFSALTDEKGNFTVKLPAGKYEVRTLAAVSKKFVLYLEISDTKLNPNNLELSVETNLSCCDKTSDGRETEVVKFVAPPYPPAARAVRAAGEVVVEVKIDKDGKVVSATAISGHPLLRAASQAAARQWLFTSDESSPERSGQIVFAFLDTETNRKSPVFIKVNRLEIFATTALIEPSYGVPRNSKVN